jgi:hypothetical protein
MEGARSIVSRPRRRTRSALAATLCAIGLVANAAAAAETEPAEAQTPEASLHLGLRPAAAPGLTPPPSALTLAGDLGSIKRYPVDIPSSWAQLSDDAKSRREESKEADRIARATTPKSYVIPALEILGFQAALNLADRAIFGCCDYDTNLSSIHRNLRRSWVTDNDPYAINQLGHPYQGSIYHGIARSTGLSYWESFAYTFAGSAVWEIAGETTPPSKNDQIATGIGGTFLGEALFRMSNLFLEKSTWPKPWREVGAAVISPPVGFNRLMFKDRFDTIFASRDPAYYLRLQVGAAGTTQNRAGTSTKVEHTEGLVDLYFDYGLPGKSGYAYTRPFDYFNFQATASTANVIENLQVRGTLFGKDYDIGNNYRGVWGLYGTYDYIAPQTFRIGSTGAALGTTAEWWL